jgi:two-component system, LytTR family, sensor kinase
MRMNEESYAGVGLDLQTPRRYLTLRELPWRFVLGVFALNTLCLFAYRQLDFAAYHVPRSPLLTFCEEAAGNLAGLLVFPLLYLLITRFPLLSPRWRTYLPIQLLGLCLISLLHTTAIAVIRALSFPLLGYARETYGYLPIRYPMEFAHLFIYYWLTLALVYLLHEIRFARERELKQAHLATSLAEARLENLRLQIEPHFLFNALNAVSAALYEDPRKADEMIGRLGEFLRQLVKDDRRQFVPLSRELELLRLYASVMEARFEERLSVQLEVEDNLEAALVPPLLLQPLLENAIRHGMNERFEARILVTVRRQSQTLWLSVRDHGMGLDETKPLTKRTGLGNTTERLEQLYGKAGQFEIRNAPDGAGGTLVSVRVPLQFDQTTQGATNTPSDSVLLPDSK